MAEVILSEGYHLLTAANTYVIGDGSADGVSTLQIQFVSTAFVGSIVIKARSRHGIAKTNNAPFNPIPYVNGYVNGAVGDGAYGTAAITTDSDILIPASGRKIALDTAYTSGTMAVYIMRMFGAAA